MTWRRSSPGLCEFPECRDQSGKVGLQASEARIFLQRFLIHIKRAVDLDLQAVPPRLRPPLPLDDLDALVDFVDPYVVATTTQHARDKIGEFLGTSGSVAVAEHEIRRTPDIASTALRWHRMAIDMPDRTEFGMEPGARLVEDAMIGDVAALDPRQDLVDRQFAVVDRGARTGDAAHEAEPGPCRMRRPQRRRPSALQERLVEIVGRTVGVEIAARK